MQNPQQPTLTAMLAQQRQADIARAAEHHRVAATALASSLDAVRTADTSHTRAFQGLQSRFATIRSAVSRTLGTRAARDRMRGRTATVSTNVACCA